MVLSCDLAMAKHFVNALVGPTYISKIGTLQNLIWFINILAY